MKWNLIQVLFDIKNKKDSFHSFYEKENNYNFVIIILIEKDLNALKMRKQIS